MRLHVEPLTAVVRVYADGASRDNYDPYVWAVTLRYLDRKTVEMVGVTEPPSFEVWRTLKEQLHQFGIDTVVFKRRLRDGTLRTKRIDVRRRVKSEGE